jgi:hypothetical protein
VFGILARKREAEKMAEKKSKKNAGVPNDWEVLSTHIGASIEVGLLTEVQASMIATFAEDFIRLVERTNFDKDSPAAEQIQVIHKILRPEVYEFPLTVIRELASKYHGTPAINRAVALRRIMWRIAHALEPVKHDAENILDGPVKMIPVENVEWRPGEQAALHAEVERYWKPGVTLQSLAIRIYQDELNKEGRGSIDAARLRADLRALAEWEIGNSPGRGAAAEPTAPLWRLLASREVPEDWVRWLKKGW